MTPIFTSPHAYWILRGTRAFPPMDDLSYRIRSRVIALWVTLDAVSCRESYLAECYIDKYEAYRATCRSYPKWHFLLHYHEFNSAVISVWIINYNPLVSAGGNDTSIISIVVYPRCSRGMYKWLCLIILCGCDYFHTWSTGVNLSQLLLRSPRDRHNNAINQYKETVGYCPHKIAFHVKDVSLIAKYILWLRTKTCNPTWRILLKVLSM